MVKSGYILETELTGFADKQDVECETEKSQERQQGVWPKQREEWSWHRQGRLQEKLVCGRPSAHLDTLSQGC